MPADIRAFFDEAINTVTYLDAQMARLVERG